MKGAPRMAPTPTSLAAMPPPKTMAINGIIVSGSAVPTAASTDPMAPSPSSSLWPNHSMPLVNSSAPTRMTANETDQEDDVQAQPPDPSRLQTA